MHENKIRNRFMLPSILILVLVLSLISGIFFVRSSLLKMTVDERSNQLEEMVLQIASNLDSGLQTHWNLTEGLNKAIQGKHYENIDDLYADIARLEDVFCLDMYGARVMLLDNQGTAYLRDGSAGIWNDVVRLIDDKASHTFVSETDNIDGCFLVFSRELYIPVTVGEDNQRFTHVVLLKDIETVKNYYTTASYGGNAATYFLKKNGTLAYFDADDNDPIDARNVFKALEEAEYVSEHNFETVRNELEMDGIATANIYLHEREYFYCITSLDEYSMLLMLLVPSEKVAVSTMNMMDATIKTETIFAAVITVTMILVYIAFNRVRQSRRIVELEQENNKKLNQMRVVAESANAAKSTFLNNMSHDIRTPMNAIIGFTNIALKQDPQPEIKNCLDKISESSEHLLALINDVLDISRIESGKIQYTPVPVAISDISDSVLTIMNGYLSNRDIDFKAEKEEAPFECVKTDVVRLREVLVNILGNAVKFTDDGGSISYKESYLKTDEGHVTAVYKISDSGIGMSEEFIEHIFDEFSQESNDARTRYKGTGLGMTITRKYVELLGGTINVQSRKGEGSCFTVSIPMEACKGSEIVKKEYKEDEGALAGLCILMAEDNDLNAEIAMIQLEEYGIDVVRAKDGKEALDIFSNNRDKFDLILMDVMMPNMNGYEATREIRKLDRYIPIIAMTANAFAEDVQASLDAGMNDHLSKPINMDDVIQTIAHNIKI